MRAQHIRAIVYGVGEMGRITTRLLVDKGVRIVGAIGNRNNIGRDLGEVAGLGRSLGVPIDNDAERVLSSSAADVVLMSFCSDMETMFPAACRCIENGMNVVSITDESFYPWGLFSRRASELDRLARRHGVTVTGTGIQDLIWLNLVSTLSAVCHKIDSVSGEASANIDEFGPAAATSAGLGLTPAAFETRFAETRQPPTPFGVALQGLVADLGLTLSGSRQRVVPILAARDTPSVALQRVIREGEVIGTSHVDEVETVEGPLFSGAFHVKVYEPGETDHCRWQIEGFPNATVVIPAMPGKIGTCTIAVNRVPDVINAAPGFVPAQELPRIKYRPYPLHAYVRAGISCEATG
ncbi:MAG: hypothetical protein J0H00_17080 [Burkholderiales bacterium]|nr:hypothetical protein [Burkholderiales bacterium]OJX04384.1 MAG: hypothetical protein BGO72_17510 [Burkholderiales bacterium 70-64]